MDSIASATKDTATGIYTHAKTFDSALTGKRSPYPTVVTETVVIYHASMKVMSSR
jgi:hypothetical protein